MRTWTASRVEWLVAALHKSGQLLSAEQTTSRPGEPTGQTRDTGRSFHGRGGLWQKFRRIGQGCSVFRAVLLGFLAISQVCVHHLSVGAACNANQSVIAVCNVRQTACVDLRTSPEFGDFGFGTGSSCVGQQVMFVRR